MWSFFLLPVTSICLWYEEAIFFFFLFFFILCSFCWLEHWRKHWVLRQQCCSTQSLTLGSLKNKACSIYFSAGVTSLKIQRCQWQQLSVHRSQFGNSNGSVGGFLVFCLPGCGRSSRTPLESLWCLLKAHTSGPSSDFDVRHCPVLPSFWAAQLWPI